MGATAKSPAICPDCQIGWILPLACGGRRVPFRGIRVEIPAEFPIPTCNHCGAESLSEELAAELDRALETAYWSQRTERRQRGDATPLRVVSPAGSRTRR